MSIFVSINTDAPLRNFASAYKNMPTGDGNADKTHDRENPGGG
ncbi:2-keto-3-deoxygluconate permease [Escherichia sp. E2586]|nr:2-keto-3-deoxygluconate permease [Escherichia sp. E2586]